MHPSEIHYQKLLRLEKLEDAIHGLPDSQDYVYQRVYAAMAAYKEILKIEMLSGVKDGKR